MARCTKGAQMSFARKLARSKKAPKVKPVPRKRVKATTLPVNTWRRGVYGPEEPTK